MDVTIERIISSLREALPPVSSRETIEEATGKMLRKRHLANLDALGEGPPGKVRLGNRRVGYEREGFLTWFASRLTTVNGKGGA